MTSVNHSLLVTNQLLQASHHIPHVKNLGTLQIVCGI